MGLLLLVPLGFAYVFIVVVIYNNLLANLAEEEGVYSYLTLTGKDKTAIVLVCCVAPLIGMVMWDVWYMFKPNRYPPSRKAWKKYTSRVGDYFHNETEKIIVREGVNQATTHGFSLLIYEMVGACSVERAVVHYGGLFVEEVFSHYFLSSEMVLLGDPIDFTSTYGGVTADYWIDLHVYPSKRAKCKRFLEHNFQQGYLVIPHSAMLNMFRPHVYAKYRSEGL